MSRVWSRLGQPQLRLADDAGDSEVEALRKAFTAGFGGIGVAMNLESVNDDYLADALAREPLFFTRRIAQSLTAFWLRLAGARMGRGSAPAVMLLLSLALSR
jgi:hypothetical protein